MALSLQIHGRRLVVLAVALVALALLARFIHYRATHVHIDDARIDGEVVTLSSVAAGQVVELPVTQGDRVTAGQLLARIESSDIELQRELLQAQLRTNQMRAEVLKAQGGQVDEETQGRYQSEAHRLAAGEAEVAAALAQVRQAQAEHDRARELAQQKWLSPAALERAATELRRAQELHRKAAADLEATRGALSSARGSRRQLQVVDRQLLVLARESDEIRAAIRRLDNDLQRRALLSPGDGVVVMTFVRRGEHVSAGQRILMFHDPARVWVDANVKETEVARLRVGMPVEVRVDAFPDEVFTGEIERIGDAATSRFALLPSPNPSGNFTRITQRLPVRIRLGDSAHHFKPGTLVQVDVDTRNP